MRALDDAGIEVEDVAVQQPSLGRLPRAVGNPNPSALSPAWSMQRPVWTAVAWSVAIIAVCLPLASVLYRRRTTG